ncbi:prephenate dehydrogenase [Spirillospora sp. NPDC052269]
MPRRVVVVGTGLIGTSIALAMTRRGAAVRLADRDPAAVRMAAGLGAGEPLPAGPLAEPADLAVLAVPPAAVPEALSDAQKRGLARVCTDVASVKGIPLAEAAERGCDMSVFVPGHPMAGRERSGPGAARADLFAGRPWALCPGPETAPDAVAVVTGLVRACGAEPVTLDAAAHDRAVALVSHAPHVVSVAMAARLEAAAEQDLGLAGQGVYDVTRKAAGDPRLWTGILLANAEPVAAVLEDLANDLARVVDALRDSGAAKDAIAAERVAGLLRRGRAGRARIRPPNGSPTN